MHKDVEERMTVEMIEDFVLRVRVIKEIGWDKFWSMEEKLQRKILDREFDKVKKIQIIKKGMAERGELF